MLQKWHIVNLEKLVCAYTNDSEALLGGDSSANKLKAPEKTS